MERLLGKNFPSYGGVSKQYRPLSKEEDDLDVPPPQKVSLGGHSMTQVEPHPKNSDAVPSNISPEEPDLGAFVTDVIKIPFLNIEIK